MDSSLEHFRELAEKSEPITIDEIYDLIKTDNDIGSTILMRNENIMRLLECAKNNDYRSILKEAYKASVKMINWQQEIDRKKQDEIQAKFRIKQELGIDGKDMPSLLMYSRPELLDFCKKLGLHTSSAINKSGMAQMIINS